MLRTIEDIPAGGFIPEHLSHFASISVFLPDVPAVELELTKNGGLFGQIIIEQAVDTEIFEGDDARYYPTRLAVQQKDKTEVCVFDITQHGWDAVQCDSFPDDPTQSITVECKDCSAKKFDVRISWLGYQVFDEGPPTAQGSLEFRNSFDSISIEIKCLSCDVIEHILNEETA